jgi:hypothetical protein
MGESRGGKVRRWTDVPLHLGSSSKSNSRITEITPDEVNFNLLVCCLC